MFFMYLYVIIIYIFSFYINIHIILYYIVISSTIYVLINNFNKIIIPTYICVIVYFWFDLCSYVVPYNYFYF